MRLWCVVGAIAAASCGRSEPDAGARDAQPAERSLAITNVTVVDVALGRLVPDQSVVVRGGRIAAVGDAASGTVPAGATVVDGRGLFLCAGFWDMHVHALLDADVARSFLPGFVAHGITGVRDMGGKLEVLRGARWAILGGTLVGPRIVAAGMLLDGPTPVDPGISIAVATPEDAGPAVDSLARGGADFVKVYTRLPRAAYFAVLRAARLRGLPVAGHVPAEVTPQEASDSGQASIEHLRDEGQPLCVSAGDAPCRTLLDRLRVNGTWQVPTLTVLRVKAMLADSALTTDPRLATVPERLRAAWDGVRIRTDSQPSAILARRARLQERMLLAAALPAAGVRLMAGSDAGAPYVYPGSSLHEELALLVGAGLTPLDALRAATLWPAEFLGAADSMGTVAPGKVADLVLLEGNPLEDVGNTRRVRAVVLRGVLLGRGRLDSLAAGERRPEGRAW